MGDQFGAARFDETHPGRRAAGEHGQHAALADALEQLRGFFDDGQVGGEARVEDGIEAHRLERGGQPFEHGVHALCLGASLEQGSRDRRRHLGDDHGVGVGERRHDALDVAALDDGSGGADPRALSAGDAVGDVEPRAEAGHDLGAKAAAGEVDGADALHGVAHGHAAAAQHALVGVVPERRRAHVDGVIFDGAHIAAFARAQLGGEHGELATSGARAGEAVLRVAGDEQLDDGAARFEDARRVGAHAHAVASGERAARLQAPLTLDFDHAEPARRRR